MLCVCVWGGGVEGWRTGRWQGAKWALRALVGTVYFMLMYSDKDYYPQFTCEETEFREVGCSENGGTGAQTQALSLLP